MRTTMHACLINCQYNNVLPRYSVGDTVTEMMTSHEVISPWWAGLTEVMGVATAVCLWWAWSHLSDDVTDRTSGREIPGPGLWEMAAAWWRGTSLHVFAGDCARVYGDIVKVRRNGGSGLT